MSRRVRVLVSLIVVTCIAAAAAPARAALTVPAPGTIVAIYQPERKRFVRLGPGADASTTAEVTGPAARPPNGSFARFRVVDGGNGTRALHSIESRRFLRLTNDNKVNSFEPSDTLRADWTWERMEIKAARAGAPGAFEIFNPTVRRSLRVAPDGTLAGVVTAPAPFSGAVPVYPKDGLSFDLVPLPPLVGEGIFPVSNCGDGEIRLIDFSGTARCRRATEVTTLTADKLVVIVAVDPVGVAPAGPRLVAGFRDRQVILVENTAPGADMDVVFDAQAGFAPGTVRLRSSKYGVELEITPDTWVGRILATPGDHFRATSDARGSYLELVYPVASGPVATPSDLRVVAHCIIPGGQGLTTATGRVTRLLAVTDARPGVGDTVEKCRARGRFRFFEVD